MEEFKESTKWGDIAIKRYEFRYKCLFEQFYYQLWDLTGQEPFEHFLKAFFNQLLLDAYKNPTMVICRYVEAVYQIESPEKQFPEKTNRIRETLKNLTWILRDINFMVCSEKLLEELNKKPIHCN